MRILTALEDFLNRTVHAVDGAFERLRFMAEIRRGPKDYDHWGMANTYGDEKANEAMSEAHTKAWVEVLRTPVQTLEKDVRRSDKAQIVGAEEYVRSVAEDPNVVPAEIEGGSKRHFSFLLKTLSLLVRGRGQSNRPTS